MNRPAATKSEEAIPEAKHAGEAEPLRETKERV